MVSSENTTGLGPDPIDPLVDYSSLSLFPLSFKPQSSIQDERNPNLPSIDSLHSHLKSMVLKSPEKLLKQAKIILGDSLDPLKTDKTSDMGHMAYQDKAEAGFARNDKNPQEKRPALGLKRAKFSAKPMPRQLDVMLEPSIDIDKLDDPEEYFAAMERMENAKKELQRLRGEPLMDLNQNLPPLSPRHRRPSLLGKSATYRHRSYSSTTTDQYGEILSSSQKTSEHHVLSPSCQEDLSATNTMKFSPKTRISDPVPMETGKLSELDELLSLDYEGLDEADVVNLLGDKLDIKIRDIGKTSLPDMYDVRPRKSVPSGEASSKMKDKISTNLHGMMKSMGARLLRGGSQSKESVPSQTSSKSPLASISLLNRHISKLAALKDPFSLDIDSSPTRSSPETQHQRQSDLVDVRMDLSESCLKHGEERTAVGSTSVSAAIGGENGTTTTVNPEERFDDVIQSDQAGTRKDVHEFELSTVPGEESDAVSGRDWPISPVKVISPTSEPKRWEDGVSQSDQVGTREELCELMNSPAHKDERIADECEGSPVFPARDVDPTSQDDQQEDEMVEVGHSTQQINVETFHMEKSIANVEGCGVGEASNVEDFCAEEPTKEKGGSTKRKLGGQKVKAQSKAKQSKEPVKKGSKETTMSTTPVSVKTGKKRKVEDASPKRSKEKELRQRRQSLYDCGTRWEAGIRRSTRIRMRPLEYWRGERFLYGRVHNSLVTVIGVKYASPSKEAEKPAVKVKSFVSDEYKDLVESAALH